MFGIANELFISFGLYLFFSLPFTETEYIALKCLTIIIILFCFLVVRAGGVAVPSWFHLVKNLLDPLIAKVVVAARRVREALLL